MKFPNYANAPVGQAIQMSSFKFMKIDTRVMNRPFMNNGIAEH